MKVTKVYKFRIYNLRFVDRAGNTSDGAEFVRAERARGEAYKRKLLENVYAPTEAAVLAKMREESPELDAAIAEWERLNREIDALYTVIRETNQKARRRMEQPETMEKIKELSAARKAAYRTLSEIRWAVKKSPSVREFEAGERAKQNDGVREGRKTCEVHWGTYQRIEEAARQSLDAQKSRGRMRISYKESEAGGVAVHLQGDSVRTVGQIYDGHCAAIQFGRPVKSGRRFKPIDLSLAIGKPHHGTLHASMRMHRLIPDASRIAWAVVQREQQGTGEEFYALFTVSGEEDARPVTGKWAVVVPTLWDTSGKIADVTYSDGTTEAIDLGVVVCKDKHGNPVTLAQKFNHDVPQSRADSEFTSLKESMADEIEMLGGRAPDWLKDAASYVRLLRNRDKVRAILERWISEGIGDVEVARKMLGYSPGRGRRVGDKAPPVNSFAHVKHLYDWKINEEAKARRQRTNLYRNAAKRIASECDVIVMQDLELKARARKKNKASDGEGGDFPWVRRNRKNVALSELALCLKQAMALAPVDKAFRYEQVKAGEDPVTHLSAVASGAVAPAPPGSLAEEKPKKIKRTRSWAKLREAKKAREAEAARKAAPNAMKTE